MNTSAAHADTRGVHVRTVAAVQIRERVKGNDITMSCTAGRARLVRVDTVAVGIHVLRGQFKWQSRANMMLQGLRTRVCVSVSVQTHTACNQPVISDATRCGNERGETFQFQAQAAMVQCRGLPPKRRIRALQPLKMTSITVSIQPRPPTALSSP